LVSTRLAVPHWCLRKHLLVRVHRRSCGWISRASRLRNRRRTVDKSQQRYRRYLILGLRVGTPFRTHSEGNLDRQAAASLTFCSDAPTRASQGGALVSAPLWHIWPSGLYERNCLPLTLIRLDVTTDATPQRIRTISGRWNHLLQQLSHLPCIVTPSPSRLESRCDQLTGKKRVGRSTGNPAFKERNLLLWPCAIAWHRAGT